MKNIIKSSIWGCILGDCCGVPYEFKDRTYLDSHPCKIMAGHGTYCKPKGTWSDDTSLILATLDGMTPFSMKTIAKNFVDWKYFDKYTQCSTFDIGNTTSCAISKMNLDLSRNEFSEDIEYGGIGDNSLGNGSLMRMMPVALFLYFSEGYDSFEKRRNFVYKMSALTHADIVCKMACHIYVEYIISYLILSKAIDDAKCIVFDGICDMFDAYRNFFPFLTSSDALFSESRENIGSNGYVVDSLKTAFWCLLTSDSYEDTILKAINLGGDTDTNACIAGGLAGLVYGIGNEHGIPISWKEEVYKSEIIDDILEKFINQF